MRSKPSHGGYPGDVIAHDTYLRCADCGWSFTVYELDDGCCECGGELLETRATPAPEATLRLDV